MNLKSTPVSRCLDKKMILLGFEVPDLLAIFLTLSVLNLVFGQTSLKIFLVWLPTLVLAGTLRFAKRGKPEGFLVHWVRYQIRPGVLSAFSEPTVSIPLKTTRKVSAR
jgi:hypothetical protein